MKLPIDELLPDIRAALRDGPGLVLEAPPGAGKTTRVPPALLGEPWLADRRVILLEPRRLAARAAATFMAGEMSESVGRTVGYRMRMDTRTSHATRIEVVTEGVLTRMLQSDPALEGIGAVIFDEFHERSIHADLGLALCLDVRDVLRPDLRIIVMSATLAGARVAPLLGGARVIRSEGRLYEVETIHLERDRHERIEAATARAVRTAIHDRDGDVLVFLPGVREIRATARRLDGLEGVIPLHGGMSTRDQQRAIAPSMPGRRKIVLSTSIAETSLTIEGVRIVVDAGLMRVPRFSPRTGMTRLETLRVTRDTADQRRGRAGRTAPGTCYRLWSEAEDAGLVQRRQPEILEADLAPLALELAAWGTPDPAGLRWLDVPPPSSFARATEVLSELAALDPEGRVTDHGRALAGMPAHPRIAHMLAGARDIGCLDLACDIAAIVEERDPLQSDEGPADPDISLRIQIVRRALTHGVSAVTPPPTTARLDRGALARIVAASRDWRRRLRVAPDLDRSPIDDHVATLLAMAWPDRIAKRRGSTRGTFVMRNGAGARMPPAYALAGNELIVAAALGGRGADAVVLLAAPLAPQALDRLLANSIETAIDVEWDSASRSATATRRTRLGAIVLSESPARDAPIDQLVNATIDGIRADGLDVLPWTKAARSIRERLQFLHVSDSSWPDVSDQALLDALDEWLGPYLAAAGNASLDALDPGELLLARLDHRQRARFDSFAPTHFEVPSGSRISIDYSDPEAPALPVRIQEVFGLLETPRLAGGGTPITLRLLSPAMRPVQVTRDLASFWRDGYFDVRRDLRGRYPKHYWPDNPLEAQATRRTKPRR